MLKLLQQRGNRRGPMQEREWGRDEKDVENDDSEGTEVISKK